MTTEQLEQRLDWVERMLATAHPKDLPSLNKTYQRLLDELVRRDLETEDEAGDKSSNPASNSVVHVGKTRRRKS